MADKVESKRDTAVAQHEDVGISKLNFYTLFLNDYIIHLGGSCFV